ncbi:MAG: radical SAM protein [bacterium]
MREIGRRKKFAFMMADIKDSTVMYRKIGDVRGKKLVLTIREFMINLVKEYNGQGKGTEGDAFLAWFQDSNDCVRCALEIQRRLATRNRNIDLNIENGNKITVNIGLHRGRAELDKKGDPEFSLDLSLTKRILDISKDDQIFASEDLYNDLKPALRKKFKLVGQQQFKGFDHQVTVYEIKKFGIVEMYSIRGEVEVDEWTDFFKNTKHKLDIMGHSMIPIFTKHRDIIYNLLYKGCTIRVLLLNPYENYLQQFSQTDRWLPFELRDKIHSTLKIISDIKDQAKKNGCFGMIVDKVTNQIMFRAMTISDDRVMYVHHYLGHSSHGDKTPTYLLEGKDTEHFKTFSEEFNSMWDAAEFTDQMNSKKRILLYLDHAKRIWNVMHDEQNAELLPLPKQVIIYPTYICSFRCPNCMYKDFRGLDRVSMNVDLFAHILNDLDNLRNKSTTGLNELTSCEIAGGGEPMEHHDFVKLLSIISKKKKSGMKFGLITNGKYLEDDLMEESANVFDYIRLSYVEGLKTGNIEELMFYIRLGKLANYCKGQPLVGTTIGVKILMTKTNKDSIIDIVKKARSYGATHIKVKSIRGMDTVEPSKEEIREMEEKLYSLKSSDNSYEDLQIDVRRTSYPEKFRCWLNPISPVIDPNGGVFVCFGYHNDPQNMEIGKYRMNSESSLSDFWGSNEHKNIIQNLSVKNICKASYTCNCRIADYQQMIQEIINMEKVLKNKIEKPYFPRSRVPDFI